MTLLDALRVPEFQMGDFLVPWGMVISTIAFLLAWIVTIVIEANGWTRAIWHLPLFFVALAVLFGSVLGLVFAP